MMTEKQRKQLKEEMAKERWYGSKEHFRTEKSYEEHIKDIKKKLNEKRNPYRTPSINELMRM